MLDIEPSINKCSGCSTIEGHAKIWKQTSIKANILFFKCWNAKAFNLCCSWICVRWIYCSIFLRNGIYTIYGFIPYHLSKKLFVKSFQLFMKYFWYVHCAQHFFLHFYDCWCFWRLELLLFSIVHAISVLLFVTMICNLNSTVANDKLFLKNCANPFFVAIVSIYSNPMQNLFVYSKYQRFMQ